MPTSAAQIREKLHAHGAARAKALATADAELDAIVKLIPAAVAAGINMKQISEIAGVSRPTLYARRTPDP